MFAHLKELSQKIAKNNELVMLAHEKELLSQEFNNLKEGKSLTPIKDTTGNVGVGLVGTTIVGTSILLATVTAVSSGVVLPAAIAGAAAVIAAPAIAVPALMVAAGAGVVGMALKAVSLMSPKRDIIDLRNEYDRVTYREENIDFRTPHPNIEHYAEAVGVMLEEKREEMWAKTQGMFEKTKNELNINYELTKNAAKFVSQFVVNKVKSGAVSMFSSLKEKIKSLVGLSSMAATTAVSKADHVLASAGDKIDSLSKTKDAMAEKLSLFVQNAQKDTAFFTASNRGDIKTMSEMVRDGYDVERRGNAALRAAVVSNNVDAVGFLLREGANYRAEVDGKMLLTKAILNGSPEITSMLMDAGATLGVKNQQEINNMMFDVAKQGNMKAVEAYVVAGANPKSVVDIVPQYERESLNKIITDYDNSKGYQSAEVNTAQKAGDMVSEKDESDEDERKTSSVVRMRMR